MRIKITNDLFDIAERIKVLNKDYEIYFDTEKQKYTLFAGNKLQLTIPYDNLDERTIYYAYHTRTDNYLELEKEAEKYNAKLDYQSLKQTQDTIENEFTRLTRLHNI